MATKAKKPQKTRQAAHPAPPVFTQEFVLANIEIEAFAILPENPLTPYVHGVGRNTLSLNIDSDPDAAEVYIRLEYQLTHYQKPNVIYAMATCNFDFGLTKFVTPDGKRNKEIPWEWPRQSREQIMNVCTGLLAGIVYTKSLGTYLDPLLMSISGGNEILDMYEKAFPDQRY